MNVSVKLMGHGGHSVIDFTDSKIAMEWKSTTEQERKTLNATLEKAKTNGFKTPEGFEAKFDVDGKVALEGGTDASGVVLAAISSELSSGKLVMDDDKIVKMESLVVRKTEAQVLTSRTPVVGG